MLERVTNNNEILSVQDILDLDLPFKDKYKRLEIIADERKKRDPQLAAILSKDLPYEDDVSPEIILERNMLPKISVDFRDKLHIKAAKIDPLFTNNGNVYVFRGDYPNLANKGLYSYLFREINLNLDQMLDGLKDEPLLPHDRFHPINKLEEFMWMHSNGGLGNFLSTTTNYEVARLHPGYKKNAGTVYVLKLPLSQVFRNYASTVSGDEQEVLAVDYILPSSIVSVIDPHRYDKLDVRDFM